MIEVHPGLFVGNEQDFEYMQEWQSDWAVVHACKEPYHRQALGYTGRSAPKTDPEYLVARRGSSLMLNMVDTDNPLFFAKEMIDEALDFIDRYYMYEYNVLIHCNQGESRGPSIALLYMAARLRVLSYTSFDMAETQFRELYPNYHPKAGIRGHLQQYWHQYCKSKVRESL